MNEVESRPEKQEPGKPSGIPDAVDPLQLLKDGQEPSRTGGGAEPNHLELGNPFEQDSAKKSQPGTASGDQGRNLGSDAGNNLSPAQENKNNQPATEKEE